MDESERLMTVDEVADILRVNRLRVYELARTGVIPSVRMGRQVRFAPTALREWILAGGTSFRQDPTAGLSRTQVN